MTTLQQRRLTLPAAPPRRSTPPGARRWERSVGRSQLAITGRRRAQLHGLTALWIITVVAFWAWWLPGHLGDAPLLYAIAALAMAYVTTILPSFYVFFVARARVPEARPAPPDLRVAVITPCVPSAESEEIVEAQLRTLAALDYPCDVWLLDEGDDPHLAARCEAHGIHHFSRRGHEEWNQPGPPFQAKTKAGNVNAWIDHALREGVDYDVFVQFDIDHRPRPDYLDQVLGHFADPRVGWVQAPSVSGNLEHWTARGQAEQETALQGSLQMGFYGHSRTPFIIGSHTSYRMSAIREIGGYQPTRAEDHLDTVVLAAYGYRGVYVPQVIAVGDGPTTFATYLGQQFAWAYSMAQIFFEHTPRLLPRYTARQAFQFLMAQSWYTLWSLSCAVLWLLPLVALATNLRIATVPIGDFLIHYLPLLAMSTLLWWWSRPLFQPTGVTISWRWMVLEAARWPIVLWAIGNAIFHVSRPYMITPKGSHCEAIAPGLRLYAPYLLLAWTALGAIGIYVLAGQPVHTAGYLWLGLLNAAAALLVVLVAGGLEARSLIHDRGSATMLRSRGATLLLTGATAGALLAATVAVHESLALTLA